MNILPITNQHPACYGMLCPHRTHCQRYSLVETSPAATTISRCEDGNEWPLYVPQVQGEKAKEVQHG